MGGVATVQQNINAGIETHQDCCPRKAQSPWLKQVDIICRVALGIIGIYLAPLYMALTFGLGFLAGAFYAAVKASKGEQVVFDGDRRPVCGIGYMEFLTGLSYPPVVVDLATTTFIAAHMHHYPYFYVPFAGALIGFWAGIEMSATTMELSSRLVNHVKKETSKVLP